MKILMLTRSLGWPLQDGYSLRLFHLARLLGTRHELHLLCAGGQPPAPAWTVLFHGVTTPIAGAQEPRRSLGSRLLHALSPDEVHRFDPQVQVALEQLVADAEASVPFAALWVCGDKLLQHSARLRGRLPVLADVADDDVLATWTRLRSAPALRRPRALLEWARSRRFQSAYLPHAALTTVVAGPDRDSIVRRHPRCEVAVVTNGVDHDFFSPAAPTAPGAPGTPGAKGATSANSPEQRPAAREAHGARDRDNDIPAAQLVFEGNMRFPPNVQAAVHFCRDILPLIRERFPELRVALVGRDPAAEVRALAGPGVIVTGEVEDVRPWLREALVFVCPLLSGAGIKNKILQAWAMALPVVATKLSCAGLSARPGRNLLVADAPRAFADAVIRLLDDPTLRTRLGAAGRTLVRERYGWEASARVLEELLETMADDDGSAVGNAPHGAPLPPRRPMTLPRRLPLS